MLKCPVCNKEFDGYLPLKSKDDIYMCNKHGLFSLHNGVLVPAKYPCPHCEGNYKLPKYHEGTWAVCECEKHGEWRVSFLRSFKFRKLCSIVASKPNRDPNYYTPPERKAREILDSLNIKYEHNRPFHNGKHIYYPDFVIEEPVKLLIEVNPSIWHSRWNRAKSDRKKIRYFISLGYTYLSLDETNYGEWEELIREKISLGRKVLNS